MCVRKLEMKKSRKGASKTTVVIVKSQDVMPQPHPQARNTTQVKSGESADAVKPQVGQNEIFGESDNINGHSFDMNHEYMERISEHIVNGEVDISNIANDNIISDNIINDNLMNDPSVTTETINSSKPREAPPKKRPGRPKKLFTTQKSQLIGIVDQPYQETNELEVKFQSPKLLKKISTLFEQYNSDIVEIIFDMDIITFTSISHTGLNKIIMQINAKKLMYYYCKTKQIITIKQKIFNSMFSKMDKSIERISMFCDKTSPNILAVVFNNPSISNDNEQLKPVAKIDNSIFIAEIDDAEPEIEFKLNSKLWKNKIANIIGSVGQKGKFVIEKNEDQILLIRYDISSVGESTNDRFEDGNAINLRRKTDNVVSIEVSVQNIKPVSNCLLGDDIHIGFNSEGVIYFKSFIDKVSELSSPDDPFMGHICKASVILKKEPFTKVALPEN